MKWFGKYRSRVSSFLPTRQFIVGLAISAILAIPADLVHILPYYVVLLGAVAITVFVLDAMTLPAPDAVSSVRDVPRLYVGVPTRIDIRVHLAQKVDVSRRVWIRDDVPQDHAVDADTLFTWVSDVGAVSSYLLTPAFRGDAPFGDVHMRIEGRYRLALRQYRTDCTATATVWPDVRLTQGKQLALTRALTLRGETVRAIGSGAAEFSHIREYAVGDDPRTINWFASARQTGLMRNVYQPERGQHIILALDSSRAMGIVQTDGKSRLDLALEALLLTARGALSAGDEVSVLVFSDHIEQHIPHLRGEKAIARLVDALHAVRAKPVFVGIHTVIDAVYRYETRHSLLIVFSDFADLASNDILERNLKVLERRHTCVFASFTDESLEGAIRSAPDSPEALAHIGAAALLLQVREDLKQRLRARHMEVIEERLELYSEAMRAYVYYKNRR